VHKEKTEKKNENSPKIQTTKIKKIEIMEIEIEFQYENNQYIQLLM